MRLPAFLAAMFGAAAVCTAQNPTPQIQIWPRAAGWAPLGGRMCGCRHGQAKKRICRGGL